MPLTLLQAATDHSEHIYNDAFAGWTWKLTGDAVDNRVIGIRVYDGLRCITVNFEGTRDVMDLWKDLSAALPEHEGRLGWVAEGFFRGTEATHAAIMAKIKPYVDQGYSVIYGGHSLGGAQAADNAAYAMVSGDFVPHALIGLGLPRPGRSDLWNILDRIPHLYMVRNELVSVIAIRSLICRHGGRTSTSIPCSTSSRRSITAGHTRSATMTAPCTCKGWLALPEVILVETEMTALELHPRQCRRPRSVR